ncbi:MAG: hypothetical protein NVSMB25_23020 [Thermoleophilaceae bacterium]
MIGLIWDVWLRPLPLALARGWVGEVALSAYAAISEEALDDSPAQVLERRSAVALEREVSLAVQAESAQSVRAPARLDGVPA